MGVKTRYVRQYILTVKGRSRKFEGDNMTFAEQSADTLIRTIVYCLNHGKHIGPIARTVTMEVKKIK